MLLGFQKSTMAYIQRSRSWHGDNRVHNLEPLNVIGYITRLTTEVVISWAPRCLHPTQPNSQPADWTHLATPSR